MDAIPKSNDSEGLTRWAGALDAANSPNLTEALEMPEMARILTESVERLPKRARLVLTLHYYESLTFYEIGGILEMSESRVCRLHSLSIERLTDSLNRQARCRSG